MSLIWWPLSESLTPKMLPPQATPNPSSIPPISSGIFYSVCKRHVLLLPTVAGMRNLLFMCWEILGHGRNRPQSPPPSRRQRMHR